jgi:hypothetical protein
MYYPNMLRIERADPPQTEAEILATAIGLTD